jgi:cytochrome c-type biogenesis protein CcmE
MKARQKRLAFVVGGLVALALVTTLVLYALKGNLSYFFSPSEVASGEAPAGHVFRLGGLVVAGSVARTEGEITVRFDVTDNAHTVPVQYSGILPDLFQEGQGVIAQGRLSEDGVFVADEVLAKHDETYMPPEVADALAQAHEEGAASLSEAKPQ